MNSSSGNSHRHLGGGTIGGLLHARASAAPGKAFLVTKDARYTYAQTDEYTDRVARSLLALGATRNDVVAMMMANRPEFMFAWFGTVRAGMVHVPVNTAYKGETLAYIVSHCEATVLICDEEFLPNIRSTSHQLGNIRHLVVTQPSLPAGAANIGFPSALGWDEFLAVGDTFDGEIPSVSAGDLSAIVYTSGTTGPSKGVMTPHLHNITQGFEAAHALRITSRDVLYTCLPLFHGNAQWATVMNALTAGATVALSRRFSASGFWAEVRELGATECNLIGSMLYMLDAQPPSDNDRKHKIKSIFSAPAPTDIFYRFEERFGVTLVEGYGLTETKNVAYNPYWERRPGSFGKPTASSILTILGEDGRELPPGQVGEIAYRPKHENILCKGYLKNPEATLDAMSGLWWHTGDLGYRDADGYFYFVDRKKDSIRRRGENISSFEVERVILSHPAVADAAVVAVASEVGEDEVMAMVVEQEGAHVDFRDLFRHCDVNLPYFMVPRYYRVVDDLPRTPNDKIRKVELRAQGITPDTWDSADKGLQPTRQIVA